MVLDVIGIRNDSQRRLPRRRRYGNWHIYFDMMWPRIRDDLIDLINLCEMKFHVGAFVITKKYANELSIKR